MKQAFRKFDTAQTPYSPALSIVICVSIPPFFQSLLYSLLGRANVTILGSTLSRKATLTTMAILDQELLLIEA
jgi:hypothetical protein